MLSLLEDLQPKLNSCHNIVQINKAYYHNEKIEDIIQINKAYLYTEQIKTKLTVQRERNLGLLLLQ